MKLFSQHCQNALPGGNAEHRPTRRAILQGSEQHICRAFCAVNHTTKATNALPVGRCPHQVVPGVPPLRCYSIAKRGRGPEVLCEETPLSSREKRRSSSDKKASTTLANSRRQYCGNPANAGSLIPRQSAYTPPLKNSPKTTCQPCSPPSHTLTLTKGNLNAATSPRLTSMQVF